MNSLGEILYILNDHDSDYIYNEHYDGLETSKIISNGASFKYEEEKVANNNILVWMNQFSVAGDDHGEDKNILRIVWIRRDVTNESCHFEITKDNENRILERFDLKDIYRVVGDGAFICSSMKDVQHSKKQRFALGISGHVAVLAWTYNLTTAQTEAVCWSSHFITSSVMRTVLEHRERLARHPMFLVYMIAICISQSIQHLAESIRYTVNKVESRTQHCHLSLHSRAIAEGSYASLSAMMSASATRLASLESRNEVLREILDIISAYQWPSEVERPEWAETVFSAVDESVQKLRNRQKGHKIRIRYLTRRAEIQLTTVCQLQQGPFFSHFALQCSICGQVNISSSCFPPFVYFLIKNKKRMSVSCQPNL